MTTEEPAAISLSARSASQWKTILLCERPSNEQPQSRLYAGPRSFFRHCAEKADTGSEGGKPFRPVVFQSPVGLTTAPTRVRYIGILMVGNSAHYAQDRPGLLRCPSKTVKTFA